MRCSSDICPYTRFITVICMQLPSQYYVDRGSGIMYLFKPSADEVVSIINDKIHTHKVSLPFAIYSLVNKRSLPPV